MIAMLAVGGLLGHAAASGRLYGLRKANAPNAVAEERNTPRQSSMALGNRRPVKLVGR
jgi:hypothetical protein